MKPKTRAERVREASRERREMQRQEVRRLILDAAAALFLEHGYEQFSMRQIAERIGYSATTIYRYFADKDELLFAVVDLGFEQFGAALARAAETAADPATRLQEIGRAYVRFGRENPAYYQLMFLQRTDYLATPPEGCDQPRSASFLVLEHAVQAAIDAGRIRPGSARAFSNMLWALVHGITSLVIAMPQVETFPTDEDVDAALSAAFEGLRAP